MNNEVFRLLVQLSCTQCRLTESKSRNGIWSPWVASLPARENDHSLTHFASKRNVHRQTAQMHLLQVLLVWVGQRNGDHSAGRGVFGEVGIFRALLLPCRHWRVDGAPDQGKHYKYTSGNKGWTSKPSRIIGTNCCLQMTQIPRFESEAVLGEIGAMSSLYDSGKVEKQTKAVRRGVGTGLVFIFVVQTKKRHSAVWFQWMRALALRTLMVLIVQEGRGDQRHNIPFFSNRVCIWNKLQMETAVPLTGWQCHQMEINGDLSLILVVETKTAHWHCLVSLNVCCLHYLLRWCCSVEQRLNILSCFWTNCRWKFQFPSMTGNDINGDFFLILIVQTKNVVPMLSGFIKCAHLHYILALILQQGRNDQRHDMLLFFSEESVSGQRTVRNCNSLNDC